MASNPLGKLKLKTQDESRYGKQVHAGFLNKRSKGKSWTQRYAVLWEDMALRFYETEQRGSVLGKIKMKHVTDVKKVSSEQSRELDASKPFFFSIVSTSLKKTWQFGCDDTAHLSEWVHILQSAITVRQNTHSPDAKAKAKSNGTADAAAASNEFSVAQSLSSRASAQSMTLSALDILDGGEYTYTRRSVLSEPVPIEEDAADDDEEPPDSPLMATKASYNVEQTLIDEDKHIVFQGQLDRKTNQKVLGKHLWETRFFALSTHSLSIYTNEKASIAESVIKLSSMISVSRNTKNDGSDLKDNRFDIHTKTQTLNLRCENEIVCKQWIHFLSLERKKHRQSVRAGLDSLESTSHRRSTKRRSAAVAPPKPGKPDEAKKAKASTLQSKTKTSAVKRFKRQRTSRSVDDRKKVNVEDPDEDDDDDDEEEDEADGDDASQPKDATAAEGGSTETTSEAPKKRLSMKSWAASIQRHHDSVSENAKENERLKRDSRDSRDSRASSGDDDTNLLKAATFEGFLIRKIGHNANKIGEKLFFRLADDTLEFSKVDTNVQGGKEDIVQVHSANVLGTISLEHIKAVRMVGDGGDGDGEEFMIVHNERDSKTDWLLTTERSDKGKARQWVQVLQRAQIEAQEIAKRINKENEEKDEESDSESESAEMGPKSKKRKRLALARVINDETIQELESARNDELHSSLANGFEINANSLSNANDEDGTPPSGFCRCFCWK